MAATVVTLARRFRSCSRSDRLSYELFVSKVYEASEVDAVKGRRSCFFDIEIPSR